MTKKREIVTRNVFSNKSSPGGREDILRFLFLPPIHAIIKHATLGIALATTKINAPSTNAPTVPAGPPATTPIAAPFVVEPPYPLLVLPPTPPDDPPDLPVVPLFRLPHLAVPTRLILDLGARVTGTAPPFQTRTTLTFTKTSPVMGSLTA